MAVSIKIKNVMKKYEKNIVIHDLSAEIAGGELFTLLGPSGCGKTTLLRMIAGFNSVEAGTIAFDDQVINDIPVHKRNFGMVFQNYAIFPNMTVFRNIEYGLKNKKLEKVEIQQRVEEIMETVQITPYRDRYPDKLSGGQQQRVALARAIVVRPQVLLMDEPLSNLDAKLRIEMREAIREIQKKIGITTVYVTHDQEEALAISDRIAVMNKGDIQQIDIPEQIYSRPYNTFVADFIGHSNHFAGTVLSQRDGMTAIRLQTGLEIQAAGLVSLKKGEEILVYVRPEEFIFTEPGQGMKGTVTVKRFLGKYIDYHVDLGTGAPVEVTADTSSAQRIYAVGEEVSLTVNVRRINFFSKDSQLTLVEGVESHV
ncbi:ABC transporter ATP-binding protein [Anaerotruncus sp. AF02-27]|uniref:ABC transporter ATP-binding protein n=1 Tax=Anaerotruncus TaxID=244127 RepID=UPI000E481BC1|nr:MULTISPECIES: ABC transporter ATP-binding protein [Anaerotruncus]RGX55179.1 ABC transporter ATP-binding protein [Anaerotruncus sp. AF02-27]